MDLALTRDVPATLDRCELSFRERQPIDVGRAREQHRDYCERLARCGLEVVRLPADDALPDCCFVEDTAVVLDELAVVTVPGAASRRGETAAVAEALGRYRRLERMAPPASLDGGDVLQVGRRLFVGRTRRSNEDGIAFLRNAVASHGYDVVPVTVTGCLHLKSAVTALDDETLLANAVWLDTAPLAAYRVIGVDPHEPAAANVLRVRGELWAHAGFPRTIDRLDQHGYRVTPVDVSEFVKAEAALTCKSLLFRRPRHPEGLPSRPSGPKDRS
jgi:dimethylargininase